MESRRYNRHLEAKVQRKKKDDFDKIVFTDSEGNLWSVGCLKELVEAVRKKKESEKTFDFYFG